MESPLSLSRMHWDHEPDWRHSSPCLTGVQEKRGHVPPVQRTLRTLDCGGTTPLSLRVSPVPDALEFAHAFCLAPDGAERVAECRDGGSWKGLRGTPAASLTSAKIPLPARPFGPSSSGT